MARSPRSTESPTVAPHVQVMSLDQVDAAIVGGEGRRPSDAARVRATTRALQAMTCSVPQAFATLECEQLPGGGLRVVRGHDAILVARQLRARAAWRGDDTWAALMGSKLRFRVVTRAVTTPAGDPSVTRPPWHRRALRGGRRLAQLAGT